MTMLTWVLVVLAAQQPAPPELPQQAKFRVTGLWSKDREPELQETAKKVTGITLVDVDFDTSEITLAFDASLFGRAKRKEILERLDNGFRQNSGHTFGIRPACPTPKEKLTRIEIGVVGLDCKGCCLALYDSVARIEGVEQATASFKEGRLTALIDPEKTNREALVEALKKRSVTLKP